MYPVQLTNAIQTRMTSDATLAGLCTIAPIGYVVPSTAFPYVAAEVEAAENVSAFRTASVRVVFRVHVWHQKDAETGTSVDPLAVGHSILLRIYGDWTAQTYGTGPTYGFDRWQPSLSGSGMSATHADFLMRREQHEDTVYHWIDTYALYVSKEAA